MNKPTFFSVLLVLVLGGCTDKYCNFDPEADRNPPVLFQYEYYNYAWGFRHHGFMIDERGYINGFQQPTRWIAPDSTGMLTREDLEHNLDRCDTICGKVDRETLYHYFDKIEDVRFGKVEDTGNYMADAGIGILSAWYWNKQEQKYESVFLASNGDMNQTNINASVNEIVEWLKDAGKKTERFYWFGGH